MVTGRQILSLNESSTYADVCASRHVGLHRTINQSINRSLGLTLPTAARSVLRLKCTWRTRFYSASALLAMQSAVPA